MEQLGSHRKNVYEIWYLRISRKSVEKIPVPLKSDKNNGYFTWRRLYIYDDISLNSSQNEKCFGKKLVEKVKTHIFMFNNLFFSENPAACEIMWKNMVEPDRLQIT